jgi:hypothetical protein
MRRLMGLTSQVVVFNLLHQRSRQRHDHCFYYNPLEVRRIVEGLGCACRIVDNYLPNDFTILCRLRRGRTVAPPRRLRA